MKIGFIGQGWVGKHYADDFENRNFSVVRYSNDEQFLHNKKRIKECDFVFIAVPTPTTKKGFSYEIVSEVLQLVGKGKTAVIKSSLLPGTTKKLQDKYPSIRIVHSPEFLKESTAAYDASNPQRNIIGVPRYTSYYRKIAQKVLDILPQAPYELICHAEEAEFIKYAGNCFLYTKVVYMNVLYDLAKKLGISWEVISQGVGKDSRIGNSHMNPLHGKGRGAGGHCFIKDFAALQKFYPDPVFKALEKKNIELLKQSKKDLLLLKQVYE